MLIIMGTSLKVHGLKKLVKDFARTIHASNSPGTSSQRPFKVIFVNKTPPALEWADVIDYHVAAESDRWVTKVLEDWKKMRPADWEVQQTLVASDGNTSMSGGLKVIKTVKSSTEIKEKRGIYFSPPLSRPMADLYHVQLPRRQPPAARTSHRQILALSRIQLQPSTNIRLPPYHLASDDKGHRITVTWIPVLPSGTPCLGPARLCQWARGSYCSRNPRITSL